MGAPGAPIVIEGSHGEGGGALVRTALCMSALTQQPVRINNVRGGTKYPGLDLEDWILAYALAHSCTAEVVGAELGSQALSFLPTARPRGLAMQLDETVGTTRRSPNALVVLSSLLPVLARTGMYSRVSIHGETYGNNALTYDYFANVTLGALARSGLYAAAEQLEAGFGRESMGEVSMEVEPSAIEGLDWKERGRFAGCRAIVVTSALPAEVGSRAEAHLRNIAQNAGVPCEIETTRVRSHTPGAFVTVWADYDRALGGATAMGARGVRIESLAQRAFGETLAWMESDATIDPFLCDHLLLPAVLAEGESIFKVSRLTARFLTSVWVVKQFLPIHITVKGSEGEPGVVSIRR